MSYLALCAIAAALGGANFLPDPSFEAGKWELAQWDHGTSRHEFATPGRTGDKCVHLVGLSAKTGRINELAISPVLPAPAGRWCLFAVWYRTTGAPHASLSMTSFAEPFATAEWKTPKLQYTHKYLPDSPQWRLALWRFKVADKAVEMRVMVRLAGEGEVWFDDASLVPVGDYQMTVRSAGDLYELPDGRVFSADVTAAEGKSWKLKVINPAGKEL